MFMKPQQVSRAETRVASTVTCRQLSSHFIIHELPIVNEDCRLLSDLTVLFALLFTLPFTLPYTLPFASIALLDASKRISELEKDLLEQQDRISELMRDKDETAKTAGRGNTNANDLIIQVLKTVVVRISATSPLCLPPQYFLPQHFLPFIPSIPSSLLSPLFHSSLFPPHPLFFFFSPPEDYEVRVVELDSACLALRGELEDSIRRERRATIEGADLNPDPDPDPDPDTEPWPRARKGNHRS